MTITFIQIFSNNNLILLYLNPKPKRTFMKQLLTPLILLLSASFLNSCQKEPIPDIDKPNYVPVADAGPSKNIKLPVNTVTLTGIGSSKNGPVVGYLWSLISGPNVPVIQSQSAATTIISGFTAGNYNFQFMVIDSLGYTGIDTAWVRVAAADQVTITPQPANNINELNFAVIAGSNVSAQDIDLDAGAWTSGGADFNLRGAMKFDLSSIPNGATIISAKLSLYSNPTPINGDRVNPNSGSNNSMWIRRLVSSFSASSTWATQPATETTTQVLIPHTSLATLDLIDVDVKNIVTSMMNNGNYGFMMGLQNEVYYNIRQFASSRHSIAAKHPKLVVTYQ